MVGLERFLHFLLVLCLELLDVLKYLYLTFLWNAFWNAIYNLSYCEEYIPEHNNDYTHWNLNYSFVILQKNMVQYLGNALHSLLKPLLQHLIEINSESSNTIIIFSVNHLKIVLCHEGEKLLSGLRISKSVKQVSNLSYSY